VIRRPSGEIAGEDVAGPFGQIPASWPVKSASTAAREFALVLEALKPFVHQEPLRRVYECVFGVLALESEPVDPRL
jgi:hypothetical protein